MKVLLVKPEFKNAFTKLSLITTEPLELEYMSAICKRNNVESKICDLTIKGPSLHKMLKKFRPDVVAMTANFVHIYSIVKYVRIIKSFDPTILTVVGGPHAEVVPQDFYLDGIDIVFHSGGFQPFESIITGNDDYPNMKGICYRKDEEWVKNEREIFDVSNLPFPDRTHFYENKKKYKYVTMKPCAILKSAYSCPNSCNYCFSTLLNGGKYLCRDPRNVVEEIKSIDCEDIWIVDDTFYVDKTKLDSFIHLIKEQKIHKRFSLYFRADFIAANEDYIRRLSEIGVTMCAVGLEVIDDEVLEKYNKKSSVHIILKALEILERCNITCIGLLMIDIDSDKEYFKKLYKFIDKHKLYMSTISILTPMPGTLQYEKYKERIVTQDYRKWDFVHLTINPTQMSRLAFYRRFYLLYVKLAFKIVTNKVLSGKYVFPAISASFDYWSEVVKGIGRKKDEI